MGKSRNAEKEKRVFVEREYTETWEKSVEHGDTEKKERHLKAGIYVVCNLEK